MRIEFHYKEYTCCTYIHACIHKCTYCTPDVVVLLTPSQCQIEEDPLLIVYSKHFHQKEADEYSFTQCPGEGGQEEVVHEGCHNFAGSLVKRSEKTSQYYTVNNAEKMEMLKSEGGMKYHCQPDRTSISISLATLRRHAIVTAHIYYNQMNAVREWGSEWLTQCHVMYWYNASYAFVPIVMKNTAKHCISNIQP